MQVQVIRQPYGDADREAALALDALAEGLADRFIAKARAEVARERGLSEDAIDREHGRVAEEASAMWSGGTTAKRALG
jgi:hypothetical protein